MAKKKAGRGFLECWLAEKRRCIFRQGVLRKMYGHEVAKEKKVEKGQLEIEVPMIFVEGSYFETPLCTMCWINKGGDKGRLWEQEV